MRTVTLGRTGLEVSRICYGAWPLGGDWGAVDEASAIAAVRRARSLGVNFFDTAQAYGFGASERLLGKALRDDLDRRRDEVVIATKGGVRVAGPARVRDSSSGWIRRGVEESLDALGVDHIDLYQIHWPDPDTPFAETAGTLDELVEQGKIRHVGVSNFSVPQIAELSRRLSVETLQPPYHLFRTDVEAEVLPYCREHDIGVLAYGPLGHGLLTGAMHASTTFARDDWRSGSDLFRGEAFRRNLEIVGELDRFARERLGRSVSELAIAWVLSHPAVHVAIVGSRRAEHVEQAVRAADLELNEDDREEITRIAAGAVAVAGPSPEAR
jgi:aryl-alcohol dehydrogenase-like predicted oxidoreductase